MESTKPIAKTTTKKTFQSYISAKNSMRMITLAGKRINFSNYEFITNDKGIIRYLDMEIEGGLNSITKGEALDTSEINPMERLRAKHFAEFQEAQSKEAPKKDGGKTDSKPLISPASSKNVAN